MICGICSEDHEENRCPEAPVCPKCGNNRQVWVNQISGRICCHRLGCEGVPYKSFRFATPPDPSLRLRQLITYLEYLERQRGDVPVVLWDRDTGSYFELRKDNFEVQRLEDSSIRISLGVNEWTDPKTR